MNVRTLCLSILHSHEASGYEIRKLCTEGECSYFIEASYGSIYPALARLEEDGLVTSRIEHQTGKPSKKIYAITDAGRTAFVDALHEPLGEDVLRSPFLLFARFAHLVDVDVVRARIEQRLAEMDAEISGLCAIQKDLEQPGQSHANDAWVLSYGLSCLEVAREHLHTNMNALLANARQPEAGAQAAE